MVDEQHRLPGESALLQGLRVVEFSRDLAAPLAGMLLAEQGAEVVRIVSPAEPAADPVLDAIVARGKTETALDFRQPEAAAVVHRLLAQADVAIENLGQEALRRLGIDFDGSRREQNPGLISCSIPSFPPGDPRAGLPGHEAIPGMAGFLYHKPLGKPRYHDLPVGSVTAALYAVNGIMAALIARLQLKRGQHVSASLYQASMFSQVIQILVKAGVPRGFLPMKMVGSPAMRVWLCRDQRYVYLHITIPAHNVRILELLDNAGYHDDVAELRAVMSSETMRDPSQVKSIREAKRIRAVYERIFLTKTADEWEEILGKELCCIKVRTTEEWLRDSMQAGMTDACKIEDPEFGELLAPGPSVFCPEHPPVVRARTCDPAAFDELLQRWESLPRSQSAEVGADSTARPALLRFPLEGVRVMDLSRVIAGPCATRVLAELGADVLSVQSASSLDWMLSFHLIFNAGKRSVTLDFTSDEGKRQLWAIMDAMRPHAFVQNYRHLDLAKTIGVGPEEVRARFPHVAYAHLNAYGNEGWWKDRPGFEQVVQAVSGIQSAYAGGGKPRLLPTPIIDIGCGLLGAFGILMGIYHERTTGQGAFVNTHLTGVSLLLQLRSIAAFQREACLKKVQPASANRRCDPQREVVAGIMRALRKQVCVAGPRRDLRAWLQHLGLARAVEASKNNELAILREHFSRRTVAYWQRSLIAAGVSGSVAIMPAPNMRRIVKDIRRYDDSPEPIIRRRNYPGCAQPLIFIGSPLRLSMTPLCDISPPPVRGADTRSVMAQIGIDVAPDAGVFPYPPNKPLLVWLVNFLRWGYFAWQSGNI